MSKLAEPTRVEWREGGLFVRLDTERERIAISATPKGVPLQGVLPPTPAPVVNVGTQEAVTLADMLRNAVAWLDVYLEREGATA